MFLPNCSFLFTCLFLDHLLSFAFLCSVDKVASNMIFICIFASIFAYGPTSKQLCSLLSHSAQASLSFRIFDVKFSL